MGKGVTVKKTDSKTEKGRIVNVRFFPVINDTFNLFYLIIKRSTDIFFSIIGCVLTVPIMVVVKVSYLANSDRAPIFFTQERIGKNGKTFKLYKFRTMVTNADELLKELLKDPEIRAEWEEFQKLENDPRITKVGRILRKTSLDEFPQFLNIFKGDMSLVGPRPYLPRELNKIPSDKYKKIISVRPGITGFWQVSGRSELDFKTRTELETYYADNFGLILDTKIFFKTFSALLKREGAN